MSQVFDEGSCLRGAENTALPSHCEEQKRRGNLLLAADCFAALAMTTSVYLAKTAHAISSDDELREAISNTGLGDVYNIFDAASQWVLVFGAVIAAAMFLFAGIMFLTARGDAKKLAQAKSTFMYALWGTLLIIIARGLVVIIGRFVS